MESRAQGSRPRTQKKPWPSTALPRTDPLEAKAGMLEAKAKDQGHKRKRSPKNKVVKKFFQAILKKSLQKYFQAFSSKKRILKVFFLAIYKISTIQKKCCYRAEDRAIFENLRPRGQGQGLQNVSSRTSSRPRTSSRTPPLTISLSKIYPKCKTKRKFNEYTSEIDRADLGK